MCITFDSAILFLEIHPFETESQMWKDVHMGVFTAALFIKPKQWKWPDGSEWSNGKYSKAFARDTSFCTWRRGVRVSVLNRKSMIYY